MTIANTSSAPQNESASKPQIKLVPRQRRKRFRESEIASILHEGANGSFTDELCHKYGISERTYYRWKAKYGELRNVDSERVTILEDENRRLRHLVAEQALENYSLQEARRENR